MRRTHCQMCRSELADGPFVDRTAEGAGFRCRVTSIPTKICSRGCPGFYWYWPDFGVEVIEGLSPDSPNIAKRKLGLLKARHICRNCGSELAGSGPARDFSFSVNLRRGSVLGLTVTAPSLICSGCGAYFMPAQTSSQDPYYTGLADVLGRAITTDLIYR